MLRLPQEVCFCLPKSCEILASNHGRTCSWVFLLEDGSLLKLSEAMVDQAMKRQFIRHENLMELHVHLGNAEFMTREVKERMFEVHWVRWGTGPAGRCRSRFRGRWRNSRMRRQ